LFLPEYIDCVDFCFYLCCLLELEIFRIFSHLGFEGLEKPAIFSFEKLAKFCDILCMLIEI
jgi:hypothetical protein